MRNPLFVRSRVPFAVASALVVLLSGCGDSRIRKLSKGISRDSAMKILGGTPADSTPYIYHTSGFIVNGRRIDVLYYDVQGRKRFRDSAPGEELTPVVLEKGQVEGWGWANWDSVAKSLNIIPIPHKQ
jgi:hypothetical protein